MRGAVLLSEETLEGLWRRGRWRLEVTSTQTLEGASGGALDGACGASSAEGASSVAEVDEMERCLARVLACL